MYSEEVADHFMHPRNMGKLENPSGSAVVESTKCGDIMWVQIKVEKGIITQVRFRTNGCSAAVAAGSRITEAAAGRAIDEAIRIADRQLTDVLNELLPIKMHCIRLAHEALCGAIADYEKRLKAGEIREE